MRRLEEEYNEAPYDELEVAEEPPPMLNKAQCILLNMTSFGINFMVLLLSVEVIPAQVEALVGDGAKGSTFGGMVAGGAALTFFVSPVVGMVSDRLTYKLGKRRPVMIIGTIILCFGLIGMAFSAPQVDVPHRDTKGLLGNTSRMCQLDLVKERCAPYMNKSIPAKDFTNPAQSGIVADKKSLTEPVVAEKPGNLGLYITFFLMVICAQAAVTVPFNALVADKSHPTQRGFNSGVMGAMILLGNVSGAAAGLSFTHIGVIGIYGLILGILVLCVTVTVVSTKEYRTKEELELQPLGCKLIFCGFWEPLKEHDFRWVFITRFLMQQGVATVTGFLEYWLGDMIPLPNCWTAATSVSLMLLPMLFAAAFSSVIFGIISDRTNRRKSIVTIAAVVMGCCALTDAFLRGNYAFYIAVAMAFVFGTGFGAFQSVDFALVMDVLPEEKDKAKDIAVWHLALILPQVLATPVGGVVLDIFERVNCEIGLGYIIVFVMTSFYFLLSGLFVFKIRRAK
ncbi:uncharacterized protein LOC124291706 isoform X1 [Haliotis rubra]|uniref:uncharacterized protein LOC124291706 isoform X1 n=1 Tax=Haliotis rubra TaxID=36100 RepID=UPI001EE5AFB0|nr:uncharacterized protein LOC124291706 isoform X1 [Haliotis rubra]